MGQLVEEVKLWNTPILGAYYLWRFTQGFINNHRNGDAPIGLLHFIVTAILTNKKLAKPITNQRADLQSYIRSFEDNHDSDILLIIQERIKIKLEYTLQAIDIGVSEGLFVWDMETGKIYSKDITKKPRRGNALKNEYVKEGNKAETLGKWLSQHDLSTISNYLKLVL